MKLLSHNQTRFGSAPSLAVRCAQYSLTAPQTICFNLIQFTPVVRSIVGGMQLDGRQAGISCAEILCNITAHRIWVKNSFARTRTRSVIVRAGHATRIVHRTRTHTPCSAVRARVASATAALCAPFGGASASNKTTRFFGGATTDLSANARATACVYVCVCGGSCTHTHTRTHVCAHAVAVLRDWRRALAFFRVMKG